MSEPNNGGGQQPGPDPDKVNLDKQDEQDKQDLRDNQDSQDEARDQSSDSFFSDPTAPVWADSTTPMPSEPPVPPTPPGGAHTESWQPAGSSPSQQPPSAPAPPMSNPYAQQPPVQTYGEPGQTQSGQPQYGQPQYGAAYGQQTGQQSSPYGQQPYSTGPATQTNGSAIALTVVSGFSVAFCNIFAIASLIVGIMALSKNATDPTESRRLTKMGWIILAALWAFAIVALVVGVILLAVGSRSGGGDAGASF